MVNFVKMLKNGAKMLAGDTYAAGMQHGNSMINGFINEYFQERARKSNFEWNEKAAQAADQRQRKQYADLYSPNAMMEQYRAAGLSPSMMYSGGAPAVGSSTANGSMSQGIAGMYPAAGLHPTQSADVALKMAQIRNLDEDTTTKDLQNQINKLTTSSFKKQWELLNSFGFGDENGASNISKIAKESENYEEFAKKVGEIYNQLNPEIGGYLNSENGQKDLRTIYRANKEFSNDIAVLANSQESAQLLLNITKLLNNDEYANLNAKAQKQQLEQAVESAGLEERQKGAMNRLIDKMGDSVWADLALVFMIIVGQYSHMNLNFGAHATNVVK